MDFRTALLKVDEIAPLISFSAKVALADAFATPPVFDLTTHEARVAFARSNPTIMSLIDNRLSRIPAVKALREASEGHKVNGPTYMTLREALDVVNEIGDW